MATPRRLANPPIQEAVIDIRVNPSDDRKAEELQPLIDSLTHDFPSVGRQNSLQAVLSPTVAPTAGISTTFSGFVMRSADTRSVLHIARNRFAAAYAKHYDSWESLEAIAALYFMQYVDFWKPKSIDRVGVRYINVLPMPDRPIEIEDYLTCAPSLPEAGKQHISAFNSVQQVRDVDTEASITVRQIATMLGARQHGFIIDIDVSKEMLVEPATFAGVKDILRMLRVLKNNMFFGLVTELALGPYS